jgi:osmotically-inducible protein OsmY
MKRRVNDGDISGLKLDKFRNSKFEISENRSESSSRFNGVSQKTANTLGGPNLGLWNESGSRGGRSNKRFGGAQLDHSVGHAGKGPRGYKRADESIYEDVCSMLEMSADIDASQIEVSVKDGIVYLRGSVEDRDSKRMAEYEIENISGVHDVQNLLGLNTSEKSKGREKDLH